MNAEALIGYQIDRIEYRFNENEQWRAYENLSFWIQAEGITVVRYRAIDDAGHIEPERLSQIHIDTIPPTTVVELQGEAIEDSWFSASVEVTLAATDTNSGVRKIEYRLNGAEWQDYMAPITLNDQGVTTFHYRAVDVAGNVEPTNSRTIRIGTLGPVTSSTVSGDEGDAGWFLGPVVVTLQATTPDGEIERVEYRFGQEAPWQVYHQPFAIVEEGATTLRYRSIDDAGRIESEKTRQILIDTAPATTTMQLAGAVDNDGWFVSQVDVTLSATDPEPGSAVKLIEFRLGDDDWQSYVHRFTISDPGMTPLHYRAVDRAGNVEATNSFDIWLRKLTTVSLEGDEGQGGWFLSSVKVTLQATSPGGGIDRVEYRFDEDKPWQVYDEPFTINQEGVTTLHYRAIDDAGWVEPEQIRQIGIDTLPPATSVQVAGPADSGGCFLGFAWISFSATDAEPGSGVSAVKFRLNEGPWGTYDAPILVQELGVWTIDYWTIDVAGNVEGTQSRVISVCPSPPGGGASPVYNAACTSDPIDPALGAVQVLLIRVDFPDLPGDPVSESNAQSIFAQASQFMRESSWGQFWFEQLDVTPTFRMPQASTYYAAKGACELAQDALAAVSGLFAVGDYWSYAIGFAQIGLPWAGLGHVDATRIWLQGDGINAGTVAHEFGHNMGMWHSTLWDVDDGNPLSPDGAWQDYGDPFDVMGWAWAPFPDRPSQTAAQFNTIWKERAGWMDMDANVVTSPEPGVHRIYAHDFGVGTFVSHRTYAIRIPAGDAFDPVYWLEYRQTLDNSPEEAGVQIRLTAPWREYVESDPDLPDLDALLLDMSGGATAAADLPLGLGETFVDPKLGVSITYVGAGIETDGNWWADVQIGLPGWQNPRNPFDVNADGVVSAYDVLLVINEINWKGSGELPSRSSADLGRPYFDVNGDGDLTAADVLDVINFINRGSTPEEAAASAGEAESVWTSREPSDHGDWWLGASRDTGGDEGYLNRAPTSQPTQFPKADARIEWFIAAQQELPHRPESVWRQQACARRTRAWSQLLGLFETEAWMRRRPELPDWETLLENRQADQAALDAYFSALV